MSEEPTVDPAAYAEQFLQREEMKRVVPKQVFRSKRALYKARAYCRGLLRRGLEGTAKKYAKKHGMDLAELKTQLAQLDAHLLPGAAVAPTLPPPAPAAVKVALAEQPVAEPEPACLAASVTAEAAAMSNGWPVESKATIWAPCRNTRLILIHLADEREAVMWTTGRRWRIGARLRVILDSDQAKGDPRYLPVEGSIE